MAKRKLRTRSLTAIPGAERLFAGDQSLRTAMGQMLFTVPRSVLDQIGTQGFQVVENYLLGNSQSLLQTEFQRYRNVQGVPAPAAVRAKIKRKMKAEIRRMLQSIKNKRKYR